MGMSAFAFENTFGAACGGALAADGVGRAFARALLLAVFA
jgi:hypothetical protein